MPAAKAKAAKAKAMAAWATTAKVQPSWAVPVWWPAVRKPQEDWAPAVVISVERRTTRAPMLMEEVEMEQVSQVAAGTGTAKVAPALQLRCRPQRMHQPSQRRMPPPEQRKRMRGV